MGTHVHLDGVRQMPQNEAKSPIRDHPSLVGEDLRSTAPVVAQLGTSATLSKTAGDSIFCTVWTMRTCGTCCNCTPRTSTTICTATGESHQDNGAAPPSGVLHCLDQTGSKRP